MSTLGTLKADVALWLNREDLTTEIPTFIRLAEADIFKDLRIRDNEFKLTLTQANAPINPIELPDNFRALKLVTHNGDQLKHVSDQEFYAAQLDPEVARPVCFTLLERSLYLAPWISEAPASWDTTEINIHYWGTESLVFVGEWNVPPNPTEGSTPVESTFDDYTQTDTNTTRLLQVAYDLYLYGTLKHAALYLGAPAESSTYREMFLAAKAGLITDDRRAQFSGSTSQVSAAYGT